VIAARLKPRNCRQCGERFMPDRLGQTIHKECVYPFALKLIEKKLAAKAKTERVKDKARKQALETIPDLIKVAQREFNAFVRTRDRAKGCFVCGRSFDSNIPGRALHAGHVRSRGAAGHLRFTEDNCMGECEGCNGPRGAKPHEIKAGAIARIGAERFAELENDNEPHKWTREELRAIAATYKQKRKELEDRE
jgi:hypothetical protein